jgi:hypothetical protein
MLEAEVSDESLTTVLASEALDVSALVVENPPSNDILGIAE